MITIEEAKELGFVENDKRWPHEGIALSIGEDFRLALYEQYTDSLYIEHWHYDYGYEGSVWNQIVNISHLNAEQVKQLITLLKP